MTWWNRKNLRSFDAIICHGAVRSGKTMAMVVGFFLWSMATFQDGTFALCGRSITALRRNVTEPMKTWLSGVFQITERLSRNQIIVTGPRGVKNTYYLFGGQDEAAAKEIQGITLSGALLDEAAIMARSFVEQACARCSVPGSRLWFNCNPEGPEHWFYREWILKAKEKNALVLHFTMDDNPALQANIRRRYERLYTGVFYRRFILGQWAVAEGLIYDFDREKHLTRDIPKGGKWYISVDYGTQNPFSAGLWCTDGNRAVRVKEFYHDGRATGRQLTDQEYHEALEALAGDKPITYVVIDPSASSMIALLRKKGVFSVRKARNQVLPGIRLVGSYLKQGALQFFPECRDTFREFGLYTWLPREDAPRKEHDHAMDDIRYFCTTVLSRYKERKDGRT